MSKTDESPMTERERAMMAAFAETMRTVMTPMVEAMQRVGAPPEKPRAKTPDELHAQLMGELRGQTVDPIALGLVDVVEGCTSDVSGASFDAEVNFPIATIDGKVAGKLPGPGRVVKLLNYKEPEGIRVHTRDGGLVPDGMVMTENYGNGPEMADGYKQWVWENFWQADLRRFVGKPLPAHIRADAVKKTA